MPSRGKYSYNHEHIHSHGENHNYAHESNHKHHHRNLKDIENIINSSELNDKVKELSLDTFMKVAEAEAKVHGKDLYEVHFHEVGAIDSIVDMVGAAICLDYLNVDKIMASPVQLGGGLCMINNDKYSELIIYLKSLGKVVLAFSGGVDSTFLLRALKELDVKSPLLECKLTKAEIK